MSTEIDNSMMQRALELARKGQGSVEPNPMVGAVIAHSEKIVGEGWHRSFGGSHAEIHALQQAGEAARGATLHVTLEPCCHHGKTPPCTDAIIKAGIARVVAAGPDPFPAVSGQGLEALHQVGIDVRVGVLQSECEKLNAPYFKLTRQQMPYVIAKWAMTLDGRIATTSGDSKWISGEESRRLVHQLRGRMDAIIVGIGTVLADDPLLTARPSGPRVPLRIVLDTELRIPDDSQLLKTLGEAKVLVVHSSIEGERIQALEKRGCECLFIKASHPTEKVKELLLFLGQRKMTNILVEGGARVLGSLLDSANADEIWTFVAPKWVGSAHARGPVEGQGISLMRQAQELVDVDVRKVGVDTLITGRCCKLE